MTFFIVDKVGVNLFFIDQSQGRGFHIFLAFCKRRLVKDNNITLLLETSVNDLLLVDRSLSHMFYAGPTNRTWTDGI